MTTSSPTPLANRLLAPDLAKAAGILLVVLGHVIRGLDASGKVTVPQLWTDIDHAIYLFHMPLFFYISGAFFYDTCHKTSYSGLVNRYTHALIYPLIIWSYLHFGMQYAASGSTNSKVSLSELLWAPFPPKEHFWFLGALFLMCISVGKICTLKKGMSIITTLFFITSIMTMTALSPIKQAILEHLDSESLENFIRPTISNISFFLLGIILPHSKISRIKIDAISCLAIFSSSLFVYQIVSSTPFINDMVHFITATLCMVSFYKFFCEIEQKLKQSRITSIIAFIGMNSMMIYLSHVMFGAAIRIIMIKLGLTGFMLHLIAGVTGGMIIPLMAIPFAIPFYQKWPRLTQAVLPVRLPKRINLKS